MLSNLYFLVAGVGIGAASIMIGWNIIHECNWSSYIIPAMCILVSISMLLLGV